MQRDSSTTPSLAGRAGSRGSDNGSDSAVTPRGVVTARAAEALAPTPSTSSEPSRPNTRTWRDGLPESLADSRTAEILEGVCDVDLDALDVELPRGFGRD